MAALDRIRLTGLLTKSPAPAGLFYALTEDDDRFEASPVRAVLRPLQRTDGEGTRALARRAPLRVAWSRDRGRGRQRAQLPPLPGVGRRSRRGGARAIPAVQG